MWCFCSKEVLLWLDTCSWALVAYEVARGSEAVARRLGIKVRGTQGVPAGN